jgi:hypothetical protein
MEIQMGGQTSYSEAKKSGIRSSDGKLFLDHFQVSKPSSHSRVVVDHVCHTSLNVLAMGRLIGAPL